nr:receptor-type tyrosine-protein phosphatase alpha-like [Crassostrea gigas]
MGCQEGYEGDMCNTSCRNGQYGEDCALTCGHCLGSEPCHHINGSCPRGCQKGFIGDKCLKDRSAMDVVNDNLQRFTIILFILCPVVGLMVISLCVLTNVYISRKRKRKSEREVQSKCQDTEEHVNTDIEDEESRQSLAENSLYATVQRSAKNIKTNDLLAVIKSMENNKDKGFSEEYYSIPYGEQSFIICNVGKRQENIPKNRFKTIYPYDHSRVVLQSSTNGDYINADFIKNTNGDTAYIASQGPKPKTVGDFWQMVWQENVFVIAMVTNLKEGDKKKCQRYWPLAEENEMLVGTFSIQLFSEKTYANFEVHHLKVTNKKIQEIRQITHLQYTSWPDHDSPSPLELLEYYRYVSRAMQQHPEQKLLVHCSAGIGRTGTFIALDALHRQGVEKGRINIVEYIHTMRMDRMNMIQNLSQYKFLYYALYESFQTGSHNLSKRSFVQEVDSQRQLVEYTGLPNFRMEYNDLESLKRTFNESEKQTAIQNFHLNMTKNVLPADNKRIILSSYVPGRGTYYNAVPISSFTTKDCIIAGQYPVQGAGVDLIRLLVDQDCSSLVLTHPLSEIPHSREWFSDSLLNYRVEVHPQSKLTACVNKSAVKIEQLSSKSWHKMSIYEITTWNENFPKVLLDIIRCVRIEEHIDQQNKLVVLSRDGASRCGEFCAVYNAIQQLQQDQEVDMFTIVRQLQSRRPEMISHVNEYLLCCHSAAEFIKSEPKDTYQNFPCKEDENVYANTFKCSKSQITH